MPPRLALLLLLAVAACQSGPDRPRRPTEVDTPGSPSAIRPDTTRRAPPPTPFDAAEAVFDTTEPPETVVEIPPAPPPPAPPPDPRPGPPSPVPRGPAGNCDVRRTEGFCYTYTGDGWTPETARAQCASAPDATFSAGACPTTARIATCTHTRDSAPGREIVYTYYSPYDPTLAALACPGAFERIE